MIRFGTFWFIAVGWGLFQAGPLATPLRGESALPLLAGYSQQQVEQAAQWLARPQDEDARTAAAQLLYQLRRAGETALQKRLPKGDEEAAAQRYVAGDVIRWEGRAVDVAGVAVPQQQAEVLQMPRLFRFRLDDSARYVITHQVPRQWSRGAGKTQPHRVRVVGVVLRTDERGQPLVVAAPHIQWYPAADEAVAVAGQRLLAAVGFDVGRIDSVASNDKRPLAADEPFFELLAAAEAYRGHDAADAGPPPSPVDVIDLLKDSKGHIGQWVTMPLETVRVTRIQLSAAEQTRLAISQDHYWQLDCFGRVEGRVVIQPEPAEAEPGRGEPGRGEPERGETGGEETESPIEFANRYPVSVVAVTLPPQLTERMDRQVGAGSAVTMLRVPIRVNGFYYRQWSYDTEYMDAQQAGRQFGPLLMASQIFVRDVRVAGGGIDGQAVVAIAFLVALVVIAGGVWWVGRRDRRHVQRRREREMDRELQRGAPPPR
ncbi:hypothetical protein [Roseimaritima sediminicola]|uniref:hypothetical protein n=1 Tax=Roseimaritima sediminicola TaxID=2662066 RepID=UPI0012982D36|nr:hypothetical protein [Roseimaritima sediminicola]